MNSALANSTTQEIITATATLRAERERLYDLRKGKKRKRVDPSTSTSTSTSSSTSSSTGTKKSQHVIDQSNYGKYGIIHESDLGNKRPEFDAWLRQKQVDVSSVLKTKADTMRYFKDFIEDYNTASLPHEKYYDLHAYEFKRQREEAAKLQGGQSSSKQLRVSDDAMHKRQLADKARAAKNAAAYKALTSVDKEKMKAMKEQDLLRARMKQAYSMQDKGELKRMQRRLDPNTIDVSQNK
jgi:hypothetical protein